MEFLKEYKKEIKNEYATIAKDGIIAGDIHGFTDSGSYWLNALLSGSIYGGYPNSKITMLASESGVGKTFLIIAAIKLFLDDNPDGAIFLFESESALTKNFLVEQGIDVSRVLVIPVITIEQCRHQALIILQRYIDSKEKRPIMFALDSLGMLSTNKEVEDTLAGSDTKDMTRTQLIKAMFRVVTLKLGRAQLPFLITNHTYASMSLYGGNVVSGGTGPKYSSSSILEMTKRKIMDGKDKTGNIVTCKNTKGRLTREGAKAEVLIDFINGLSRWHGMVEAAVSAGVWEKTGNRVLVNGTKLYAKSIYKNPERYFNKEILDKIDVHLGTLYKYGSALEDFDKEILCEEEEV